MTAHFTKDQRPARRILALWFPHLPSDRILRQRLGRSWRSKAPHEEEQRESRVASALPPPIILSHRDSNTQRVFALSEQAEGMGLKRGMGVADARAMYPELEIIEAEPSADGRLLEGLADWCDRYTPLVSIDGADGLYLDISGCAHLFGGEDAMLRGILGRLAAFGFDVRGGVASAPGMAWAAARFGLLSVDPGAEKSALAGLPLSALRLEPAVRAGLESVGLRTVGSILGSPRAPLARRFGKALIGRIDQALGAVDEAISPRMPVAALSVERHFAEPLSQLEDIEQIVPLLAATLKSHLELRGEGARRLQLALFRVDGAVTRIAVGTSRPVREAGLIGRLFHEKLAAVKENLDAGYGFDLVRLAVFATAVFEEEQGDLTGFTNDTGEGLALFADRVRARLGEMAMRQPAMVESHIPERAAALRPFGMASGDKPRLASAMAGDVPAAAERPIRLLGRVEPVEVTAEIPEGPPAHFRWRRALHRVARAEGPERIAPEWWRRAETGLTRDYYRVEDMDGRRYWLYREGFYGASQTSPRWFMQGIFA